MPVQFKSSVCLFALLALTASYSAPVVNGAIQEEWNGDGSFFDLNEDVDVDDDVDLDEKIVPEDDSIAVEAAVKSTDPVAETATLTDSTEEKRQEEPILDDQDFGEEGLFTPEQLEEIMGSVDFEAINAAPVAQPDAVESSPDKQKSYERVAGDVEGDEHKDDGYYGSNYADEGYYDSKYAAGEYEIDEDELDFGDYEGHYYEYDEEAERYAQQLKEFMDDFEPSDQLTTEIAAHETQSYQLHIEQYPTVIKTVMALTTEDPDPVIVKIFKKGTDMPIKEIKGQTEVLDIVEVMEEDDMGVYVFEFTNTGRYVQDMTFIIKQIQETKEQDEFQGQVSKEESRMYALLQGANHDIKHFEVEQQLQIHRIQSHMARQAKAKENSFLVTIGEIIAVIVFASFNVYYIKRVLDNKRSL